MSLNLAKIAASASAAQLVFDKTEGVDEQPDLSDAERLAVMLHAANTAPGNVTLLLKVIDRYKYALDRLIALKRHKDANGKDQHYAEERPRAWRDADKVDADVAELVSKLIVLP